MLLVDSTIWINVERGNADVTALHPVEALAVCPAIVHEVVRGATTRAQMEFAREVMLAVMIVDSPTPLGRFEEAASLYLRCRAAGYAMTGFGCLIAASAIAHSAEILHADADYERLQRVEPRLRVRRLLAAMAFSQGGREPLTRPLATLSPLRGARATCTRIDVCSTFSPLAGRRCPKGG